ncbi:glycosyltransferase [Arthrobacter sp. AK01]|uniref:glycosyltransferase family 2 protein n=1 Tax=Arthrobacter sp. AK01 TaxID=2894084 RepID=UPI001E5D05C4|nr:glycosyltransferase family 2 protein [Arthrobacter sp. AK01]MCD4852201.1 glycosyltransferase [Arthrobacter sp. AK01]
MPDYLSDKVGALVVAGPGTDSDTVERTLKSLRWAGINPVVLTPDRTEASGGVDGGNYRYDPASETAAQAVNTALSSISEPFVLIMAAGTVLAEKASTALSELAESHPDSIIRFPQRVVRPLSALDETEIDALIVSEGEPRTDAVLAPRKASFSAVAIPRRLLHTLRGLKPAIADVPAALEDLAQRGKHFGFSEEWASPAAAVFTFATKMHSIPNVDVNSLAGGSSKPGMFGDLLGWRSSAPHDGPLVSIIISTYNRGEYLAECLHSIVAQSVQDFEVILVDDGSTDNTGEVVTAFADERIRYFPRENHGISASRNFGADQARGAFIAVHDDDDIMLPWRLESQLESLEPGDHGSFGVSVHFDNATGEVHRLVHRLFNMQTALRYGNNPTHPTWLIRADVFRRFRYDESLKSGVDNNIALRMVRSGIKMKHTGENLILRRLHGGQITRSAGEIQQASAKMSQRMLKFANGVSGDPTKVVASEEWLSNMANKAFEETVRPYLPDHLVTRRVTCNVMPGEIDSSLDPASPRQTGALEPVEPAWDELLPRTNILAGVSWAGLAALRTSGVEFSAFEDGVASAQEILMQGVADHATRASSRYNLVLTHPSASTVIKDADVDKSEGVVLSGSDAEASYQYTVLDQHDLSLSVSVINSLTAEANYSDGRAFLVAKGSADPARDLCLALRVSEETK